MASATFVDASFFFAILSVHSLETRPTQQHRTTSVYPATSTFVASFVFFAASSAFILHVCRADLIPGRLLEVARMRVRRACFVLQNDAGAAKWPCDDDTLETMRRAFQDRAE